jgi:hypothetical protein
MAERVGFEPTCPCGQDAFEAPPLRPLRYLSVRPHCVKRTLHYTQRFGDRKIDGSLTAAVAFFDPLKGDHVGARISTSKTPSGQSLESLHVDLIARQQRGV